MGAQNEELLARITRKPEVCGGKPTIRGTRWSVEVMVKMLAAGEQMDYLLTEFPELSREDWGAALFYASQMVAGRTPVPIE